MLGFFLIYFIGKHFYTLAEKNSKLKWIYALLGVLSYYFATFLFGIVFQVIMELQSKPDYIENMSTFYLGIIAMLIGILGSFTIHFFLNKKWNSKKQAVEDEINNIGRTSNLE